MSTGMIALAKRAVSCSHWYWMPGMRIAVGARVSDRTLAIELDSLPDLTDPATLGCLLALVREAWGDPHASVWYDSEYWHHGQKWAWHAKDQSRTDYDTEAEALVDALERAPKAAR
jgi:hypothetical protein